MSPLIGSGVWQGEEITRQRWVIRHSEKYGVETLATIRGLTPPARQEVWAHPDNHYKPVRWTNQSTAAIFGTRAGVAEKLASHRDVEGMAVILIPLRGGPLAGREQSVPVVPDEWVRQKPTLVFDTHDLAHLPDAPAWGRQRRVIYRLTQLPEGWIYLFECDVEFDLGCG